MTTPNLIRILLAIFISTLLPLRGGAANPAFIPQTQPVDGISGDHALLHGFIGLNGKACYVAFQVRKAGARRWVGHTPWQKVSRGQTNISFSATVSGLSPDTDYQVRAIALVNAVRRNGNEVNFGSTPPGPTVTTGAAENITATSATLNGMVNTRGVASTTVFFEWGTTTSYGFNVSVAIAGGTTDEAVQAAISNLLSQTTYHFRAVASNQWGMNFGGDAIFTTRALPQQPIVSVGPATAVTTNSAALTGIVSANSNVEVEVCFEWGLTTNYGNTICATVPGGSQDQTVQVTALNLLAGTTYHFRAVATYAGGVSHSSDNIFTTVALPVPPSVTTTPAQNVQPNSATLSGTVNPHGSAQTITYFQWGTTANYGNQTPGQSVPANTVPVTVQSSITGFAPGTTYHFRAVAIYVGGVSYGSDNAFTTVTPPPPPVPPSVITTPAQNVWTNSATLSGRVNPHGSAQTLAYFQWGTTASYGNGTPGQNVSADSNPVTVQSSITGLAPGTTYHFRVVAFNDNGPAYGQDVSFTTVEMPPQSVTTEPAHGVTMNSAILNGTVNPRGLTDVIAYFEWGTGPGYGRVTLAQNVPPDPSSFTAALTGLTPGTTYYFRAIATSSSGIRVGAGRTLLTQCLSATNVVTVTNCTEADLRAAIASAGTIQFACDGMIALTSPIDVNCVRTLDGAGRSVTLSGENSNRLFNVGSGGSLRLIGLTVANGRVQGTNGSPPDPSPFFPPGQPGQSVEAGGILVSNATLHVEGCLFTNCVVMGGNGGGFAPASTQGKGGDAIGAAIVAKNSTVVLTNCTLAGNRSSSGFGSTIGTYDIAGYYGHGGGAALWAEASVVSIAACAFSGNYATTRAGAVEAGSSEVRIANSFFADNSAGVVASNLVRGFDAPGGAMAVTNGQLIVTDSVFIRNSTIGSGGAVAVLSGAAMITGCEFVTNVATGVGGRYASGSGIAFGGMDGRGGGVALLGGQLVIERSAFYGNQVRGGNGIPSRSPGFDTPAGSGFGGAVYSVGILAATNCTFGLNSANSGQSRAPGSVGVGGAVAVTGGVATLAFSTVANNNASPVHTNAVSTGGGVVAWTGGTIVMANSILAWNTLNATNAGNGFPGIVDGGRNLSSDTTANFSAPGSLNNIDPLLGPLANYGGFTLTFPLLPGSPAIDAADPVSSPATDQRGVARPQGAAPDIGAFERQ